MNSLLLAALLVVGQVPEPRTAEPATPAAKALAAFKAEAAELHFRLQSRPRDELSLVSEPVLHWENPARTGEDGALFVWTQGGRPELLGTIFTYRYNDKISRKHEFHSLALEPLSAEFRGKEIWSPKTAGVKFAIVAGATAPAATARQRLTQMKALSREFSASMTDLEGEQFQLRLMPQPLFRYEAADKEPADKEPANKQLIDGALFAYSLGTDPEVILLLEARAGQDAAAWHFALARFHYIDLRVRHKDREVWHAEPLTDVTNLNLGSPVCFDSIYATYHVERGIPVAE